MGLPSIPIAFCLYFFCSMSYLCILLILSAKIMNLSKSQGNKQCFLSKSQGNKQCFLSKSQGYKRLFLSKSQSNRQRFSSRSQGYERLFSAMSALVRMACVISFCLAASCATSLLPVPAYPRLHPLRPLFPLLSSSLLHLPWTPLRADSRIRR